MEKNVKKNVCAVLSHFSRVWLFAMLWTVTPQAPLSMGFSRQWYWSGLPCPPPGDLPDSGTEPTCPASPALQVDSLPCEPPGKPKNTGLGSLSLLQGIFPTQESYWGLLHCRWILYQLSYQGNPMTFHIQHMQPVKNDHSWGVRKARFKTKRNSWLIRDSDTDVLL